MKNFLLIALSLIVLTSCKMEDEKEVNKTAEITVIEKEVSEEFSNPAIIYGTDFLTFFKSLRKLGKYDEMVKFTSLESIDEFGEDYLKDYYENSFTNMSNSKLTNLEKVGDYNYTMHYLNSEFATKRAFDVNVVIENDSVKLILNKKYPF